MRFLFLLGCVLLMLVPSSRAAFVLRVKAPTSVHHQASQSQPVDFHRSFHKHSGHQGYGSGNTRSTLALIFGIVGLLTIPYGLPLSIAAIVLGAVGQGKERTYGRAVAGMVLGIVGAAIDVLLALLLIAFLFLML